MGEGNWLGEGKWKDIKGTGFLWESQSCVKSGGIGGRRGGKMK